MIRSDAITLSALLESWRSGQQGIHSFESLLSWIVDQNEHIQAVVKRIPLEKCHPWYLDSATGFIQNSKGAFFTIAGLKHIAFDLRTCISKAYQQPIILQKEIGYLGLLCKKFDGVMHVLIQAKVEPGNKNKVQLSPTIQATRSNFTQQHGGKTPSYLEYFLDLGQHKIIVDQIQSEQSSRFLGKRNRNVAIEIFEHLDVLPSHRWMTLGQIKAMMQYPNIVNMDTRSVLSCLPWFQAPNMQAMVDAYRKLNNYKMFTDIEESLVPLPALDDWCINESSIQCVSDAPFKVIFCNVSIEGREVSQWNQPLLEASGNALFGLIACWRNDRIDFLLSIRPEIGCFDKVEFGPTVQMEAGWQTRVLNELETFFISCWEEKHAVLNDVVLSEEGGRFYREENHNIILLLESESMLTCNIPEEEYCWLDFATLSAMVQSNNILNIQVRNLLSLINDPTILEIESESEVFAEPSTVAQLKELI